LLTEWEKKKRDVDLLKENIENHEKELIDMKMKLSQLTKVDMKSIQHIPQLIIEDHHLKVEQVAKELPCDNPEENGVEMVKSPFFPADSEKVPTQADTNSIV
jgi:hypothetical protein